MSRIGRTVNPAESIELDELVQEVLSLVQGPIQEYNVHVSVDENLPVIYADRLRMMQVFQNLIDNAVKYCADLPQPQVHISAEIQDEEVVCFVRDNGVGVEPQYHERIFGLFNKLDTHSTSTGVGLALVKRIIEVHNGRVWVASEGNNSGATFYFALPAAPQ